jgi:hypothetical protein
MRRLESRVKTSHRSIDATTCSRLSVGRARQICVKANTVNGDFAYLNDLDVPLFHTQTYGHEDNLLYPSTLRRCFPAR